MVRFRDQDGNTWVGRGPRPRWLRDALAGGKSAEDFLLASPTELLDALGFGPGVPQRLQATATA